jgi:hypothetical protein
VRRRRGRGDAVLAAVLLAELVAGVGARAAWEARDELGRSWTPAPATVASAHPGGAVAAVDASTAVVVVAPPPAPPSPPPPPVRTVPHDPFEALAR